MMNVAVKIDGEEIAQFGNRSQAQFWIEKISQAADVSRDRYSVVDVDLASVAHQAVQEYKNRVWEATVNAASDMTCSAVQDFLAEVGIDREDYADEVTYTVTIKYDSAANGDIDADDVERAIINGASFDSYTIDVKR